MKTLSERILELAKRFHDLDEPPGSPTRVGWGGLLEETRIRYLSYASEALIPVKTGSLAIIQRLAEERRQREARQESWSLVADVLGHIPTDQIRIETNPLDLGHMGTSYLEQVQIDLPEVGPGYGEIQYKALVLMLELLHHYERDQLTDDERVAIGWSDLRG